jgi:TRAP-type C4-dicarboxylate transport system permease small subunit
MIAGIIGASLLSFLAVIIGTFAGVTRQQFGIGAWPVVSAFPLIGLPVGFLLIAVLLIINLRKRAKGAPKAP